MTGNLFFSWFLQLLCAQNTLYVQPLGSVQLASVGIVRQSIESFYGFDCVILPDKPDDKSLYARSNTRYDAEKILKRFASKKYTLVLTEKDIAYRKNDQQSEWGIMGIGNMPGSTCVVSTYRLGSGTLFKQRLGKIAVHEVGHNMGLPHCNSKWICVMKDARGSIKIIDANKLILCFLCRNKLNNNLFKTFR